jgi:biopolymer transport protein ExbB/TolQ
MKMIMLSTISWSDYTITVLILLLVWYVYLIFRFYSTQIRDVINGKRKINFSKKRKNSNSLQDHLFSEFAAPFDTLEDAKELSEKLTEAVKESAERNLSQNEFQNYIRFILNEYPYVKISALRDKINQLAVSECEKYPQLGLTYEQVDSLWEEAV